MRVLFGWEFGAGLGHLTRFKPIGDRLIEQGASITLALQEIDKADPFMDATTGLPRPGYTVVQAPRWNIPTDPAARKIPTHSFADVLNLIGFGQPGAIARRLNAWSGLIDLVQPDLVIGDFAPTLRLAALERAGAVPSIMVGNGYTTPPSGRTLPPIRPWQKTLEPFSIKHEAGLLANTNAALTARGAQPLRHLVDMFHGDRTFVFTVPLVDPYARMRRGNPTLPPFNLPRAMTQPEWSERREKGVFLYMPRSHPRVRDTIEALRAMEIAGEGHIPDITPQSAEGASGPGLRLHADPADFSVVIPGARLVVHHGGLSTAIACLLAGTPQLILPWNLEHLVTARGVASTKGAEVLAGETFDAEALKAAVQRLLGPEGEAMAAHARSAAAKLDLGAPNAGVETVLKAAADLVG
jgi:hypothetical protein